MKLRDIIWDSRMPFDPTDLLLDSMEDIFDGLAGVFSSEEDNSDSESGDQSFSSSDNGDDSHSCDDEGDTSYDDDSSYDDDPTETEDSRSEYVYEEPQYAHGATASHAAAPEQENPGTSQQEQQSPGADQSSERNGNASELRADSHDAGPSDDQAAPHQGYSAHQTTHRTNHRPLQTIVNYRPLNTIVNHRPLQTIVNHRPLNTAR